MKIFLQVSFFVLAVYLAGCVGGAKTGDVPVVDIEAAIDNPRTFDLAEIAEEIEYVPLDDSQKEGLMGNIRSLKESVAGFYVLSTGALANPAKMFDRRGRFVGTRGRSGRGPGEFINFQGMTVDYDADRLYLSGWAAGSGVPVTTVVYDSTGREATRADTVIASDYAAVYKGKVVSLRRFTNDLPPIGTRVPLVKTYSTDLKHEAAIETTEKGIYWIQRGDETRISTWGGPSQVLSDNGSTLMVKEPLVDTVYYYRDGALTPGYVLRMGSYAMPAGSMGINPAVGPGRAQPVRNVMESERWLFVDTQGFGDTSVRMLFDTPPPRRLIFDRRDLAAGGFSAMGPGREPGLFLDGIAFTPSHVRDGRLVGHMKALDIVDARDAGTITRPDLKAIAATLKEDSNPVIGMLTLKR